MCGSVSQLRGSMPQRAPNSAAAAAREPLAPVGPLAPAAVALAGSL